MLCCEAIFGSEFCYTSLNCQSVPEVIKLLICVMKVRSFCAEVYIHRTIWLIFVAYEPLFQFHSLLFLAATDDENEITTRTS
jgi:hypothetical protein